MLKLTNEFSVNFAGKNYSSLVTLLAARRLLGANRFKYKDTNQSLSSGINSAYTHLGNLLDQIVATSLGAHYVTGKSGSGVIFDNIIITDDKKIVISENKLVSSVVSNSGIVEKVSKISVAGGAGINLSPGVRTFLTGEGADMSSIVVSQGDGTASVEAEVGKGLSEVSISKHLISALLANSKNQEVLKRLIGGRSKAAEAIRRNFELKSTSINVVLSIGGRPAIRTIGWSWEDIKNNPKARIVVTPDGNGGANFNIYFTPGAVKAALNKAETKFFSESEAIGNSIAESLAAQFAVFSPNVVKFLSDFSVDVRYTYNDSLYSGNIKDTSKITRLQDEQSGNNLKRFINEAEWSALVQARLGDSMLRPGDPAPPDIKERSGTFRRSVKVRPNYRTKTLTYEYNKDYRGLEHYGYHPERQVERAIRQVAQEKYATQFQILRRGILS